MKYSHVMGLIVVAVLVSVLVTTWHEDKQHEAMVGQLNAQYAETSRELVALTKRLVKNDIDATTSSIVPLCKTEIQTAFDNAINSLAETNPTSLDRTEFVYLACGYAPVQQKEVMLLQINGHYDELKRQMAVLSELGEQPTDPVATFNWDVLLQFETNRAELFRELVDVQGEIIDLLQAGVALNDPQVLEKTLRASQINDSSAVILTQMNDIRSQLEAL